MQQHGEKSAVLNVIAISWSLADRYAHALKLAEKTLDRYPDIAEIWLREAEILKAMIDAADAAR